MLKLKRDNTYGYVLYSYRHLKQPGRDTGIFSRLCYSISGRVISGPTPFCFSFGIAGHECASGAKIISIWSDSARPSFRSRLKHALFDTKGDTCGSKLAQSRTSESDLISDLSYRYSTNAQHSFLAIPNPDVWYNLFHLYNKLIDVFLLFLKRPKTRRDDI